MQPKKVEHQIKSYSQTWRIIMVDDTYKLLKNDIVYKTFSSLPDAEQEYRKASGQQV